MHGLTELWKSWIIGLIYLVVGACFHCRSKPVLNKPSVRKDIWDLHDSYIIAPADEAANNFVVICKKFYVEVLLRELGIDTVTFTCIGNSTYVPCHKSLQNIISEHQEVLVNNFSIKCKEVNLSIPRLFWIPKLHKNPYKSRFIAGAKQCSNKQLSVIVNSGFQVVREQFRKYCLAIEKNSGMNTFWSINYTLEFFDRIRCLNIRSVEVFNFSTLFTNLDLVRVRDSLFKVIDKVF